MAVTAVYQSAAMTSKSLGSNPYFALTLYSSIPSGATVESVELYVPCSATSLTGDGNCTAKISFSGGSSVSASTYATLSNGVARVKIPFSPGSYDWTKVTGFNISGPEFFMTYAGEVAQLSVLYREPNKAPTSVTLSSSTVDAGANSTLKWSGATAGDGNSIAGYKIYRATSASGTYELLSSVGSGVTSTTVTAPSTMGSSYYYKVGVTDSEGNVVQSSTYATLTARTYTSCTAPTSVKVSDSSVAPGAKVTLSWSGAKSGTNNAITGYEVYRATSASGPYSRLTTVGSNSTSGSCTVTAPTSNGSTYYYKVKTIGTKSGYDSGQSTAYASLECSFASVSAPTKVTLSATNAAPGEAVTLSWSGATAGNNNDIAGYEVHRSESVDGSYEQVDSVSTSATSGEISVTAPTTGGVTYYYKVKTLGATGGNSSLSSVYAALACTHSAPTAPTTVTVNGGTAAYALPGEAVTLRWSGAADGANDHITGYDVYRDGAPYTTGLPADTSSVDVPAHRTAGNAYTYTVVTRGTHANSAESAPCTVYAYSETTAPTEVTISDANPTAGSRVVLTWRGATPGGYNAITGYRVFTSTDLTGEGTLAATVYTTETSVSSHVDAPEVEGQTLYYRVATVGEYSASEPSTAYAIATAKKEVNAEDSEVTVIIPPPKSRKRRGFIFGDYDTALLGPWTLAPGWSFPEPETQVNFVDVPGRSGGPIDRSALLTGGDPRFGARTLTAVFECSEKDRDYREGLISDMVNRLHGYREQIIFPDDPTRYAVGRLRVEKLYSDLAHASVQVTATCEPWRYNKRETCHEVQADDTVRTLVLYNSGRRLLVPDLEVTGSGARILLGNGTHSWTLTAGTYKLPQLTLPAGNNLLTYSGFGTLTVKYREAIL